MKIQEFETLINKVRFKINRNAQNYIEFMKVMGIIINIISIINLVFMK